MYDRYDDTSFPDGRGREPSWYYLDHPPDQRLRHVVYVDGRLVDTWSESVRGSKWEAIADRFDEELQPAPPPPPVPRDPPHVQVLRWLDGVVGGRDALLELAPEPPGSADRPVIDDPAMASAYAEVEGHLARVAAAFFDDEVDRLLSTTLAEVWARSPEVVTGRPATQVAGGVIWVIGRANNLFSGGLTQTAVRRELWCRGQLSQMGQSVATLLRGVDLWGAHRPPNCPNFVPFANPDLLTSSTRRLLILWRDEALRAEGAHVLPREVE